MTLETDHNKKKNLKSLSNSNLYNISNLIFSSTSLITTKYPIGSTYICLFIINYLVIVLSVHFSTIVLPKHLISSIKSNIFLFNQESRLIRVKKSLENGIIKINCYCIATKLRPLEPTEVSWADGWMVSVFQNSKIEG